MSTKDLTPRQAQILDLIRETIDITGYPPTRAEIAKTLGFRSVNAAEDHLRALERKGVLTIEPGAARGIRISGPQGLPLIGKVAAGSPILSESHVQGHYQLDPGLFAPRADYLLKVRGASMRDAGILDGDLVAVHRTGEARPGQIVVARVEDEVTVKRLKVSKHMVELLPENPDFSPIAIDTRRNMLVIEGIVVGLIRDYANTGSAGRR